MPIGRELVAAGLGFDIVGAVYVGLGLLRSPLGIASELFADDDTRLVAQVGPDKHVSLLPLREIAVATLAGRAGLTYLLVGFVLQLGGLLVPTETRDVLVPITVSLVVMVSSRHLGTWWIRRCLPAFEEAILRSPRRTERASLRDIRTKPALYAWRESGMVMLLHKLFLPLSPALGLTSSTPRLGTPPTPMAR